MDNPITLDIPKLHKGAHPIVFLILILPFGIISGYVTVTFAYLYSQAGVSVEAIAAMVGAALIPQVIKFIWAPLVDAYLSLKKWYVLSCIVTAATMIFMSVLPIKAGNVALLSGIIIIGNVASSFLGIAVSGLAAHDTPDELRGRVSGFYQAGNLGGAGLGGGLGLWLASHVPGAWIPGTSLAVICVLCCAALFLVTEHPSTVRAPAVFETLKNLTNDILETFKRRLGIMAMILCFLPLGTGAASGLWSAVANDWKASADTVAFVTGIVSGLITAAGCLAGGWLCDRWNRQMAYVVFGLSQAVCAVGMAYCPHSQWMYIWWTSVYAFSSGLCYAGFSAFVFEAIGGGAAATKYTVYASLSNAPIWYMTIIDGWAHTRYGPTGMLVTEAMYAVLGSVIFLALLQFANRQRVAMVQ